MREGRDCFSTFCNVIVNVHLTHATHPRSVINGQRARQQRASKRQEQTESGDDATNENMERKLKRRAGCAKSPCVFCLHTCYPKRHSPERAGAAGARHRPRWGRGRPRLGGEMREHIANQKIRRSGSIQSYDGGGRLALGAGGPAFSAEPHMLQFDNKTNAPQPGPASGKAVSCDPH